jgi:hypothetical protein
MKAMPESSEPSDGFSRAGGGSAMRMRAASTLAAKNIAALSA